MKAYSANATFISNIYTQEVGDTNWNEYQAVVTGGSNSLNIRSADTTSNNLAVLSENRVSSNDTLLLSVDGSNVVSGTCGLVTNGTIKTQTSTVTSAIAARSSTASPLSVTFTTSTPYGKLGYKLKPDGKVFWIAKSDGTMLEFNIGTVGNMNTATTTGKTLPGCAGFDFSPDGKYIFKMHYTTNYLIERLTLGTPWDISTVMSSATISKSLSGLPASSSFKSLKIQPDGLGVLILYNQGTLYKYDIPTAWDVTSMSTAYSFTMAYGGFDLECSPDGKAFYWTTYNTGLITNLYAAVAATAWDPRTLGTAVAVTCSDSSYYVNYTSGYNSSPLLNLDGTITLLGAWYTANTPYSKHTTYNIDLALSKNIDISSFGLSSAPTAAWLKMPTVTVATNKSTSYPLTWTPVELELDGNVNGYTSGINATTTTAVVGYDGSGILSTGDSVVLNGTTTVTLTGVTETLNGLTRQDPGTANDYIKWSGKTFVTGLTNPKVRFSGDGLKMYVAGTGSLATPTLYVYTLSTPWDITTATWDNKNYIRMSTLNGGYTHKDFDIKPDGSSITVLSANNENSSNVSVRTNYFTMSKNHDLSTLSSTSTLTTAYGGYGTNNYLGPGRWNKNGTQFSFCIYSSTTTDTYYQGYWGCTTPYDMTTAGAFQIFGTGGLGVGVYYSGWDSVWTPDGLNLLTGGIYNGTNGGGDAWVFTRTATTAHLLTSGMFGAKTTANTATAINWPAASGITTSSTANSLDISSDGTKLYLALNDGTIYQFNVRLKTLTKYALTFPTQDSAPTTVSLPAASITTPTMTTAVVSGNIVQTSNSVTTNARAIQFKLTNNPAYSEITKVQLNLRKSA